MDKQISGLNEHSKIRVALTEKHGMAKEIQHFSPSGVEHSFLNPVSKSHRVIRSPIKGYLGHYETDNHELIEAILSPVLTKNRWIYSLANFHEALAFNLLGWPLPKPIRVAYIKRLFLKENFKKLIFWSQAGRDTLNLYSGIYHSKHILDKVSVVYPAIRKVPDKLVRFQKHYVSILFSGDFFRKGGVNVVDAFERAQRIYPTIKLTLCCDKKIDFNTRNSALKEDYLKKIENNKGIIDCGRIPRDELINTVLPSTDIYLLPTYVEAFGYAILEAMAYGIPVIATNHFAIPEMIEHGVCGFLINTKRFECEKLFKGYAVNELPTDFRKHVTDKLFKYLCHLIESVDLREKFGYAALKVARTKFSFEQRNRIMKCIYQEAVK